MLLYLKTQNGAKGFLIAQYDVRRRKEKGTNCSPRSTQVRPGNSFNLLLSGVECQLMGKIIYLDMAFGL